MAFFKEDEKKRYAPKEKQKANNQLVGWMKSILNHFWWSNATCQENPVTIREKWFCVLQYVKHDWGDNQFYHCCERGPLSTEKEKAKK